MKRREILGDGLGHFITWSMVAIFFHVCRIDSDRVIDYCWRTLRIPSVERYSVPIEHHIPDIFHVLTLSWVEQPSTMVQIQQSLASLKICESACICLSGSSITGSLLVALGN
jgi:hypothetical protein